MHFNFAYRYFRHEVIEQYRKRLVIGKISNEEPKVDVQEVGTFSKVPYAESFHASGFPSPYYNESHERLRKYLRKFVDKVLIPDSVQMNIMGEHPDKELYLEMGKIGLSAIRLGPGKHLKLVKSLPADIKPEEFDYFHEVVCHEELSRVGIYTYGEGLGSGMIIGLPPVLNFGPAWMQNTIVPEILSGEKIICLAITEPFVGSDVASLKTTAVKTPDGKHYVVNGLKKWITNGAFSDYFTTAVRTGGKGHSGISMLLIPRTEGVTTKTIKTSGSTSAGTALIEFDNVLVPVENLIGEENKGFKIIMSNFNHERWTMVVAATRAAREVVEECIKWANQRKVFGHKLIEQPVVRFKIADMIANVESIHSFMENITYMMNNMSYKEQSIKLAGPIALLKYQCTRMNNLVADHSVQIFGGRGITRTGMGRVIESFQRTNKFGAILGGAEEILADLGVRQAIAKLPDTKL